jgi:hypothetical protein
MNKATPEEVAFLKRAILAWRLDDSFYTAKISADPFMEAISEDFVFISFGSSTEVATAYVTWLNSVFDQTVLDLGFPAF